MKKEKIKICFTASSGGHMEELSRLKSLAGEDDFVLTEKNSYAAVDWCKRVYFVDQINRREFLFLLKFLLLFFQSFFLLWKEQPDIIISTGALITVPFSLLGKIMGKKVVYIESFARIEEGSLTGKLMYKVADLFIVQWEEMLRVFPKAVFGGGIF